ncbi:MAG TPA: hypothetical protein GXZ51_00995 [Acholeplasma sp.]|nr:hypothetical protein [Acholeplasma sp.]
MEIRNGQQQATINREQQTAIIEFVINDYIIYVFQGTLSEFDIFVKYRKNNSRIRTPKHIHWVVDILMKMQQGRELTISFLKLIQNYWNTATGLAANDHRTLKAIINSEMGLEKMSQYSILNNYGEYSVEFLYVLMHLLILQEKTNRSDAYMFGNVLSKLLEDELDIFSIVSAADHTGRR